MWKSPLSAHTVPLPTCTEFWRPNVTKPTQTWSELLKNLNTTDLGGIWNLVSGAEVLCWTRPLSPPHCPPWLCHVLYNVQALKAVRRSCGSCWQKFVGSHSYAFRGKRRYFLLKWNLLSGLSFPSVSVLFNLILAGDQSCQVSPTVKLAFYYVIVIFSKRARSPGLW